MKDPKKIKLGLTPGTDTGKDPRQMTIQELNECGHFLTPLLAVIKAKCMDCCCGQRQEVLLCSAVSCPLWPYRTGKNTLREPANISDERRAQLSERMKQMHVDDSIPKAGRDY